MDSFGWRYRRCRVFTCNDLVKYHKSAERILKALEKSVVPISWQEKDRIGLESVIAKELMLIEKEDR